MVRLMFDKANYTIIIYLHSSTIAGNWTKMVHANSKREVRDIVRNLDLDPEVSRYQVMHGHLIRDENFGIKQDITIHNISFKNGKMYV